MAMKSDIRTTASFNGVPAGEFKTFSGGEINWANKGAVNGGGQTERAKAGRKTIGNITIGREDDGALNLRELGQQRRVTATVSRIPLDDEGNPRNAETITYTGVVVKIGPGEADAESEDDLDTFEIEIRCDGMIS